ncbi:MAG TPA: ATP-grasp domain-containing protein [Blastocatellia bacterium]|nr:ATP-grasp domain-containing protein [Blastocatellia bacterium]
MTTLVLPPRYSADSISLWRAAIESGWEVERLHGWRAPRHLKGQDVVLYGEPLFAAVVASKLGLSLLEPHFSWLPELPYCYRRREIVCTTLGEAKKRTGRAFIKPADDKCFPARVYDSGGEIPTSYILPDSTPVLISEPVIWEREFRCFVLSREVATFSIYSRGGKLAEEEDGSYRATTDEAEEAMKFMVSLVSDPAVRLPSSVVVDVGLIAGRGWAVVEANPPWGSGIYGCDPVKVLRVIERACIRADEIMMDDRDWIIDRSAE